MKAVSKTLYIPLYGKAFVSRRGLFLHDSKAEAIWEKEGFLLSGKSASKWLTYYMGMRAVSFDRWVNEQLAAHAGSAVLHIGCGLDSRVERIVHQSAWWIDVDLPTVIDVRKKYYQQSEAYRMIGADVRCADWIDTLPSAKRVLVVMEGLSMYLTHEEIRKLFTALRNHFGEVDVMMDGYTGFAARASRYKNPVKDVGAQIVSGIDDPTCFEVVEGVCFLKELDMTPKDLIEQLAGFERVMFRMLFGGRLARRMYRLFTYHITSPVLADLGRG